MSNSPIIQDATPLDVPDSDALRFLPEGPLALSLGGHASWVAIQHGATEHVGSINRLDLNTGKNESFQLPGRPGFAFPCQGENQDELPTRFVAGVERELGIFDTQTGTWKPFYQDVDKDVTNTIINDGLVYEDNLIFGTKDLAFAEKKAGLYLYRGNDQQLIALRTDQVCSNGKMIRGATAGDRRVQLVDIDSPTRLIVQYELDIDTAQLSESKVVVDLQDDPAVPDGAVLSPDQQSVIVSMFMPELAPHGETRQYDLSSGQLQRVWRTPASPQNTCPALIPHDGEVKLLITTAVENMSAENRAQCPNAGRLFVGETDFVPNESLLAPLWRE